MSSPRGEHFAAVAAAKEQVGEALGALHNLTEQTEMARNLVMLAVGETLNLSGQDAKAFLSEVLDNRVGEIGRILDNVIEKLNQYEQFI